MRARIGALLLAVAFITAAGIIVTVAPTDDEAADIIRIDGRVGDVVDGRLKSVRVDDVRLAESLDYLSSRDARDTSTEGVWLVVGLTAIDRLQPRSLSSTFVEIGDRSFRVFLGQPSPDMTNFETDTGIPYRGALVFELPLDAIDGAAAENAKLVFREDPRTVPEGIPVVRIDLTAVKIETRIEVPSPATLSFEEAKMR